MPEVKINSLFVSAMIALFSTIILFFLISANSQIINYTPTESNGIIFEKVGLTHTTVKLWNLIHFYNLRELDIMLETIKSDLMEMNKICFQNKDIIHCHHKVDHIKKEFSKLTNDEHSLENIRTTITEDFRHYKRHIVETLQPQNKTKRSLITDFLIDTIFEKDFDEKIKNLEETVINTKIISREHLTLINKTASLFNNTFTALDEKVKNLDSKIKQLNKTQKDKHIKQNEFNTLIEQTTEIINTVDKFCKSQRTVVR